MKLVILDRDGTINVDSDEFIKSPDEWKPIPGSLDAIEEGHGAVQALRVHRRGEAERRVVGNGHGRKYMSACSAACHYNSFRHAPFLNRFQFFFFHFFCFFFNFFLYFPSSP